MSRNWIIMLVCLVLLTTCHGQNETTPKTILMAVLSPPKANMAHGNLVRAFAVSNEARRRGWKVAWMIGSMHRPGLEAMLEKKGVAGVDGIYEMVEKPRFLSFTTQSLSDKMAAGTGDAPTIPWWLTSTQMDGKRTFGNLYMAWWLMGFARQSILKKIVAEQLTIYSRVKPDAIYCEIDMPVYLSAHLAQIPIIETFSSPMYLYRTSFLAYWLNSMTKELLQDFSVKDLLYSKYQSLDDIRGRDINLKVAPTVPEMETEIAQGRPNLIFTGQLLPLQLNAAETVQEKMAEIEKLREKGRKLFPNQRVIFCYFGQGSIPFEKLLKEMPEFCDKLNKLESSKPGYIPYHCHVSSTSVKEPFNISEYTHFSKWYDGDVITSVSELTMSHGGANSVAQAIYFGVPQLVNSGFMFERSFNGYSLEKTGSGFVMDPLTFSAEEMLRILKHHPIEKMKENAKTVQQTMLRQRGVRQLFDEVEKWLPSQQLKNEKHKELISVTIPHVEAVLKKEKDELIIFTLLRDVGVLFSLVILFVLTIPIRFGVFVLSKIYKCFKRN